MSPKRIQRQRTRGWKAPAGAVYVGRGSIYGNPWKVDPAAAPQPGIVATHEESVALFTKWLRSTPDGQAVARQARKHLVGHNTGLVARPGTVIVEGPHGWGDWEVMTMDEYDAQYETVGDAQ